MYWTTRDVIWRYLFSKCCIGSYPLWYFYYLPLPSARFSQRPAVPLNYFRWINENIWCEKWWYRIADFQQWVVIDCIGVCWKKCPTKTLKLVWCLCISKSVRRYARIGSSINNNKAATEKQVNTKPKKKKRLIAQRYNLELFHSTELERFISNGQL